MASLGGKKPKPVHEREWEKGYHSDQDRFLAHPLKVGMRRSVSLVTGESGTSI